MGLKVYGPKALINRMLVLFAEIAVPPRPVPITDEPEKDRKGKFIVTLLLWVCTKYSIPLRAEPGIDIGMCPLPTNGVADERCFVKNHLAKNEDTIFF